MVQLNNVFNSVIDGFVDKFHSRLRDGNYGEIKNLFSGVEDVKKDAAADSKDVNLPAINAIKSAVEAGADNPVAFEAANKKKDNILSAGKFDGHPVEKCSVNGNVITATVKVDGKSVKAKITVAANGSYKSEMTVGNETITKYVDEQGVTRREVKTNSKTGDKVIKQFDASGKINLKTKTNSKDPDKKTVSYYDDNGKLSYRVSDNSVKKTATSFKYDAAGNLVGEYSEIKNKATGKKTTKTSVISGDSKTTTTISPSGNPVETSYKKVNGKWVLQNEKKFEKTADGDFKVAYTKEYGESTTKNGVRTRNVTVNKGGKTYYDVETLNSKGKVTQRTRYSDSAKTKLVFKAEYTYNSKTGIKTEQEIKYYNDENKLTSTTLTKYNSKSGLKKSKVVYNPNKTVKASYNYHYDAKGNLSYVTDAKGKKIKFTTKTTSTTSTTTITTTTTTGTTTGATGTGTTTTGAAAKPNKTDKEVIYDIEPADDEIVYEIEPADDEIVPVVGNTAAATIGLEYNSEPVMNYESNGLYNFIYPTFP